MFIDIDHELRKMKLRFSNKYEIKYLPIMIVINRNIKSDRCVRVKYLHM